MGPLKVRMDLGVLAMKVWFHIPPDIQNWSHTIDSLVWYKGA